MAFKETPTDKLEYRTNYLRRRGGAPLLHLEKLGDKLGLDKLYIKDESKNPTWTELKTPTETAKLYPKATVIKTELEELSLILKEVHGF